MPPQPSPSDPLSTPLSPARLKHAVRGGTRTIAVAQVVSQAISLAVLASLYRLLAPGEFGLVGMVFPLLMFLRLFTTLGLNVATVQHGTLRPGQVSSLFWLNLTLGVSMGVVTAAAAPALAWFYSTPELVPVTLAMAGISLTSALGAQHQALLERNLRLAPLAVARLAGQAAGGAAAVGMALAGGGVWALVTQQYVELAVLAAVLWAIEPWRPSRPGRGEPVSHLVRFGGYYTGSSVMSYLSTNVDNILIGCVLGSRALGFYSQAYNLMQKPVYLLTSPLVSIMLPALARGQRDPAEYRKLLLAFYRLIAVVTLPAGVGVLIVGREAMLVLGGPGWAEAGTILTVLAPAILVLGFVNVAATVFASVGRTDRLFAASTAMAAILCPMFGVGLWVGRWYDAAVLGVACSFSLTMLAMFAPFMLYGLRTVGVSARAWLASIRAAAMAAVGMGLVVLACRYGLSRVEGLPAVWLLAAEVAVGVAVYTVLARGEIRWFAEQLRQLGRGEGLESRL
ncbi:MAG: lipopolysaccharide biosynthesis protein [Pirellulales bacterium]